MGNHGRQEHHGATRKPPSPALSQVRHNLRRQGYRGIEVKAYPPDSLQRKSIHCYYSTPSETVTQRTITSYTGVSQTRLLEKVLISLPLPVEGESIQCPHCRGRYPSRLKDCSAIERPLHMALGKIPAPLTNRRINHSNMRFRRMDLADPLLARQLTTVTMSH